MNIFRKITINSIVFVLLLASPNLFSEKSKVKRNCGEPLFSQVEGLSKYTPSKYSTPKKSNTRIVDGITVTARSNWYKRTSWKAGDTIDIYFRNGNNQKKAIFKHYASQWARFGNINFDFKNGQKRNKKESIVVEFLTKQRPGICGTSSVGGGARSTKYASLKMDCHSSVRTIQHEFGHSLGFNHEQDNPGAIDVWNLRELYKYYQKKYKDWYRRNKMTYNKFLKDFDTVKKSKSYAWTKFDRQSVMAYYFDKKYFKNEVGTFNTGYISKGDMKGVSLLYPGREFPKNIKPAYIYLNKYKKQSLIVTARNATMKVSINGKVIKQIENKSSVVIDLQKYLYYGYRYNSIEIKASLLNGSEKTLVSYMLYNDYKNYKNPKKRRYLMSRGCSNLKTCKYLANNGGIDYSFMYKRLNTNDYSGYVSGDAINSQFDNMRFGKNNTVIVDNGNKNKYNYNKTKINKPKKQKIKDWLGTYTCGSNSQVVFKKSKFDNTITGNYGAPHKLQGKIIGKVNNGLFQGKWVAASEKYGPVYFRKSSSGVKGKWAYNYDKSWRSNWTCSKGDTHKDNHGSSTSKRKKKSKLVKWLKKFDCGKYGKMNLSILNESLNELSGYYNSRKGSVSGTVVGSKNKAFKGTWTNIAKNHQGQFYFYLKPNGITGYWRVSSNDKWKSGWNCKVVD